MKYFGKRSVSSFMSVLLHVGWYVVLVLVILAPFAASGIIFLSTPAGESFMAAANTKRDSRNITLDSKDGGMSQVSCSKDMKDKDKKDWEGFKKLPLVVKALILPYFEAVLILLLLIIKKSRYLFINFKNDAVFNKGNVIIIANINKLLIGFSIVTFNFSMLLVCVLLLLVCEIIKDGTALKEELDLTI